MRFRSALLLTAILAAPVTARAQPFRGVYIGGGAGWNFLGQESIHSSTGLGLPSGRAELSNGFVGLGSIGYGFGNGLRVEIEGDWRDNPVHAILRPNDPTSPTGRQVTSAVMVNTLFDLDIGSRWIFPYLGAGVGYAWTSWQNVTATAPGSVFAANDTSGRFAYQGIAGLSFPVWHVPGLSVTAEYRYFGAQGPLTMSSSFTSGGHVATGNTDFSFEHNQSVLIGLRYAFGVTPPPLPAVAAAAAAPTAPQTHNFLVFFDWDRADLTDRAKEVIAEAAHTATSGQATQISVNGYTDTSGTAQYNLALSRRRASAVAAQLITDGVPKSEIAIMGYGETHLLVPTGPNVREPQNRRVEIILH
jgi:OmpA-OmpF porin, OOP family